MPGLSMEPVPVTRPTGESIVKLLDSGSLPVTLPLTVNVPG